MKVATLLRSLIFFFSLGIGQAFAITGTVYEDLPMNGDLINVYGTEQANEKGVEGVTVTIYPGGATTTTNANGDYTIGAGLAPGTEIRLEFSTIPDYLESSPESGAAKNSTVRFVTAPGIDTDLALHAPSCYVGPDPQLVTPYQRTGSGDAAPSDAFSAMVSYPIKADGTGGIRMWLPMVT